MSKELRESHHHYHATAYGLAGELVRPLRHSIPTHPATMLVPGGGRGFQRVENFRVDGVVSFDAAWVETGGSYDREHHIHTTYAQSVIEGLNIADMVKADKVVARMTVYSPPIDGTEDENQFDITGSHFENLRVVGHKLNVKLATHRFSKFQRYRDLENGYQQESADDILCLSKLSKQDLKALAKDYSVLAGLSDATDEWKKKKTRQRGNPAYWCSAANDLEKHVGRGRDIEDTEIKVFGNFILIPKFGVVRLAELLIQKHHRTLNMVRVQMCSAGTVNIHTGGVSGGGLPTPMPSAPSLLRSPSRSPSRPR